MKSKFKYSPLDEALFEVMSMTSYYREKNNMSQEEFARKAGIDRAFLSKIECRRANPSLKSLIKIAEAMDTKLEIRFVKKTYDN